MLSSKAAAILAFNSFYVWSENLENALYLAMEWLLAKCENESFCAPK